jgi:hypothetical protein
MIWLTYNVSILILKYWLQDSYQLNIFEIILVKMQRIYANFGLIYAINPNILTSYANNSVSYSEKVIQVQELV